MARAEGRVWQLACLPGSIKCHIFLLLLVSLVGLTVSQDKGDQGMECTSLPPGVGTERQNFGCHCRIRYGDIVFSLAEFAFQLSNTVFNKHLDITFRDCGSLTLLLDQNLLYRSESPVFRPDLQITQLFIENIKEVYLKGTNSAKSPETRVIGEILDGTGLSLTLFDVARIAVAPSAVLHTLQTEDPGAQLQLDMRNRTVSDINLVGFQPANIMLVTGGDTSGFTKDGIFQHVIAEMGDTVSQQTRQMSLVLGVCACAVVVGAGLVILALVKRNRQLIKAVAMTSWDSLRRTEGEDRNTDQNKVPDYTTSTMKVEFFPKYSIVNKQEKYSREKSVENEKTRENLTQVAVHGEKKAGSRVDKHRKSTKQKSATPAKLEKARAAQASRKPEGQEDRNNAQSEGKEDRNNALPDAKENRKVKPQGKGKKNDGMGTKTGEPKEGGRQKLEGRTSFFYHTSIPGSDSSRYDLTTVGQTSTVAAEVHRGGGGTVGGYSPTPLVQAAGGLDVGGQYSFLAIREQCRQLIKAGRRRTSNLTDSATSKLYSVRTKL